MDSCTGRRYTFTILPFATWLSLSAWVVFDSQMWYRPCRGVQVSITSYHVENSWPSTRCPAIPKQRDDACPWGCILCFLDSSFSPVDVRDWLHWIWLSVTITSYGQWCFGIKLALPMLLPNGNLVHINSIFEPPFLDRDLYIITAHLSLCHPPILRESPVLQSIASPPLVLFIKELIPELNCNLQSWGQHDL